MGSAAFQPTGSAAGSAGPAPAPREEGRARRPPAPTHRGLNPAGAERLVPGSPQAPFPARRAPQAAHRSGSAARRWPGPRPPGSCRARPVETRRRRRAEAAARWARTWLLSALLPCGPLLPTPLRSLSSLSAAAPMRCRAPSEGRDRGRARAPPPAAPPSGGSAVRPRPARPGTARPGTARPGEGGPGPQRGRDSHPAGTSPHPGPAGTARVAGETRLVCAWRALMAVALGRPGHGEGGSRGVPLPLCSALVLCSGPGSSAQGRHGAPGAGPVEFNKGD